MTTDQSGGQRDPHPGVCATTRRAPLCLRLRAAFAAGAPDRMDLQRVVVAIVKVVDVTPRLWHQPTLDQAATLPSISLSDLRQFEDALQRRFEFIDKEVHVISILTPPRIFGFELRAGLIE